MKQKTAWRDYLTIGERDAIEAADKAKAVWLRLNAARAGIVNRAIKRAQSDKGGK